VRCVGFTAVGKRSSIACKSYSTNRDNFNLKEAVLLQITTTHSPATDLGYLLHKHPARLQSFDLSFGKAHVFYPEAQQDRCTAALLLDIDPVGLVRGRRLGATLSQYVNDRPYVASSFLSVAIASPTLTRTLKYTAAP